MLLHSVPSGGNSKAKPITLGGVPLGGWFILCATASGLRGFEDSFLASMITLSNRALAYGLLANSFKYCF